MKEVLSALRLIFSDDAENSRRKVVGLYGLLVAFNVAAWSWALAEFAGNAVLLGAAVLAYTFGLRHAFDADHIASIDTVTRKLMQQRKRPITVGLHFALGHALALVVFVTAVAAFAAWGSNGGAFSFMDSTAAVASKCVSASFLLVMAALNLVIARATYLTYRSVRNGGVLVEEDFDILLNKRGILARLFRPLFRLVDKSWHMAIIGFLFGLGFDTATEASLLGITGAEAAKGLSFWSILVFPALFAAGMALMDTSDSVLMVKAYGWAFKNPMRKLYYNLSITVVSAVVALTVAGIEVVSLLSEQFELRGQLWDRVNALGENWEAIGIAVVAIFLASWLVSSLLYRMKRIEEREVVVVGVGEANG